MKKPAQRMFEIGAELLSKEFKHVCEEMNHMDLFGFNPQGDSCEIEIKVAAYDFYKETTRTAKAIKHSIYNQKSEFEGFIPTRYYFFVLEPKLFQLEKFLERKGWDKYGIITYNSLKDTYKIVKKSEKLSDMKFKGELNNLPGPDFKHKRKKGRLIF